MSEFPGIQQVMNQKTIIWCSKITIPPEYYDVPEVRKIDSCNGVGMIAYRNQQKRPTKINEVYIYPQRAVQLEAPINTAPLFWLDINDGAALGSRNLQISLPKIAS